MASVVARHGAATATDTQFLVELGINDGIAIQRLRLLKLRQTLTDKFLKRADTTLDHIALQSQNHVLDNAIAILHDSSTHLHVAAAQLDEFQGVAPRLNTTDATQLGTSVKSCFL